jgi:predicted helicase/SOS-response transcriptional repressor LexA
MELEGTFPENNKRVKRQKESPIRVVIANPPYSAQQESENDNNRNIEYPALDQRIRSTYAEKSTAKLLKNLYDSYIRAIRWASDRIKDKGVVGFVTNGSFIDANNMDGLRGSLVDEFTSVYVFNLRGNARTQGELRRMEAGNVFGAGTRTPVAITLLVKNPAMKAAIDLRYHDIGDYLSRDDKLVIIKRFASVSGVEKASKWTSLAPNNDHDWINQRDPAFEKFIVLGDKDDEKALTFFESYSQGVLTSRDRWCYNFSSASLIGNMKRMIEAYNNDLQKVAERIAGVPKDEREEVVNETIETDAKQISWSRALKSDIMRGKAIAFQKNAVVNGAYRPFTKNWMYFDRRLNEFIYQMPSIFPEGKIPNVAICVDSRGSTKDFSCVITNTLPDYEYISKGQCFPLYLYEPAEESGKLNLGKHDGEIIDGYRRRDAITDRILKTFRAAYGNDVSKEDIFYYVYGVLHSPEYRTRFAADLKKMLPRIPLTKEAKDFKVFSEAGRELAKWHLNYETVQPWKVEENHDQLDLGLEDTYKVQKMTFARPTAAQKAAGEKWDKTRIIYNSHVTISKIPLEAYDYVVNGKPAIEWVMERYQVTRDKDSGIVNDPNDWCIEHKQPRYIIELVARVVRVSVETMKIVKGLPALNERRVDAARGAVSLRPVVDRAPEVVPCRPRIVEPTAAERYATCVPLVPLKAAASKFSDPQYIEDGSFEWVAVGSRHRLRKGMFVAQVVGKSMEPAIPDGAYCLFRAPVEGTRQGKIVLVQLRDATDPETGQRFTVKRYESKKAAKGDSWSHERITLKPLNPDFEPIELTGRDADELEVIAELVQVLAGQS